MSSSHERATRRILGERIAEARAAKGMTQAALALAVTGNSRAATVSDWEAGRRSPDAPTLTQIAGALGVSTDYLLGVDEGTGRDEVRDWADEAMLFVRHFRGETHPMDENQRRLVQIDMLEGYIRGGRETGKDPAAIKRLEAYQKELWQGVGEAEPEASYGAPKLVTNEEPADLTRWVDEVNRLDVPEGLKIMKLDALAATIRAEMARQDAEASKIRARAIDTAEAAADARARTVQQAEETATARARAVGASASPVGIVSELSPRAIAAIELVAKELVKRQPLPTPEPPAPPAPRPEGRQ